MTAQLQIHFLLDDLQSPINIGKVARVAEIFQMGLYIHDAHKILQKQNNTAIISDFACGAWERRVYKEVPDIQLFTSNYKQGRVVATCLREDSVRLHDFKFEHNDIIIFGNEYDGVRNEIIDNASARLYIAMPKFILPKPKSNSPIDPSRDYEVNQNGVPSLNVAVAAGIVGYEYYCYLEQRNLV